MPSDAATGKLSGFPRQKWWTHSVAGTVAGLVSIALTAPFDVVKTRFQSSMVQRHPISASFPGMWSYHILQTTNVMHDIYHVEGWRGLGPSLSGVVPSMALKFYVYGNSKRLGAHALDCGEDSSLVHALAAVAASITVSTVMNPIFLIKTRLQLDVRTQATGDTARRYADSLNCVRKILQREGVLGLYQGLGASYLGAVETVLHLALYEQLKKLFRPTAIGPNAQNDGTWGHAVKTWVGAEDEATTSPFSEWDPQIRRPCAVFPVGKGRGGLSGAVWWHNTVSDALRSVYEYVLSLLNYDITDSQ
ncbi:Mitochondrial carrier [Mycena indigotica]|uniref:Mitochondrial carrier n=1 Tax=Mycena indigotica TaxID=2126181 RepID=A0A8H6WGZ2_9AGAR|nr:Mitochondrial carrier [Mycena indigotica]KAF7311964.1 Mitochondrial carrier [Mycena indigotica]